MAATLSGTRGTGLLLAAVGMKCSNQRDDVESIQRLLNLAAAAGHMLLDDGTLKTDGAFGQKTLDAIMAFQRSSMKLPDADGRVDVDSPVLHSLCNSLPGSLNTDLLALLYLRAGDQDLNLLTSSIASVMANRNIDTPLRQAHFLAQIGHESGELRFHAEIASGAAYEGRKDLGNTQAGDGTRFKGRGLIQLTGRANYSAYGKSIGREAELLSHPELVATDPALCVDVAGWYWATHNLNALADTDDVNAVTRRINGGLNGLDDRQRLLKRAKALL
ncbi:MAG TPA: glycoside hydrolase family 19 protein [Rhodocyclaceae bacterium]|jgi:predicted chitinase|nr:glycoside hydrolase family 19 protein [Rhodocyclaceae bacterium]